MSKRMPRNRFGCEKYIVHKKKRTSFFDAFKEKKETFENEAQLVLSGKREVYIEGCTDISEYDDIMVKLDIKGEKLLIFGKNLSISGFTESSITVMGEIRSMEWL